MSGHVADRLGPYMDGELSTQEAAEVLAHLAECPQCAQLLAEMAAVDSAARSLAVPVPEEYFKTLPSRVRSRLRRRRFELPAWSLALAAALLVAVVAPLLLREGRVSPPSAALPAASSPQEPQATAAARQGAVPKAFPEEQKEASQPRPAPRVAPEEEAAGRRLQKESPARPQKPAAQAPPPESPPIPEEGRSQNLAAPAPAARDQATADAAAPGAVAGRQGFAAEPQAQAKAAGEGDTGFETNRASPPQHATRAHLKDGAGSLSLRAATAAAGPAAAAAGEARFRSLEEQTPRTADEARSLREAWRSFAESMVAGAYADEARVRAVEASALAYRLSGSPADRTMAEADANAYLGRNDALQAERVRAIALGLSTGGGKP